MRTPRTITGVEAVLIFGFLKRFFHLRFKKVLFILDNLLMPLQLSGSCVIESSGFRRFMKLILLSYRPQISGSI